MPTGTNPLREEHLEVLNRLLRSCAETREFLAQCKGCHLDVDKEERLNEEQQRIAEAIKRTFFPDKV